MNKIGILHGNVSERQQWCVGIDEGTREPLRPEPSTSRRASVLQSLKLAAVDEGCGEQLLQPYLHPKKIKIKIFKNKIKNDDKVKLLEEVEENKSFQTVYRKFNLDTYSRSSAIS